MATLGLGKHPYQVRLAKANKEKGEDKKAALSKKKKSLRTPQTHPYPLAKITEQENENESEEGSNRAGMTKRRAMRRRLVVKEELSSSEEDSDSSSSSSGSTSSSDSESDCDSLSEESEQEECSWPSKWPCDKGGSNRDNQNDSAEARLLKDQEARRLSDIDGGDLRRAGEYGQQLLQLLDKESRRAEILSDLLEREQRRNAELVDKHTDLIKLQRRANCQNQNLKQLEQHSQELEVSLKEMKLMLAKEKEVKQSMKLEVARLKSSLNQMEAQSCQQLDLCTKQNSKGCKKQMDVNLHKPQSNQLDTTPSPLKFKVGVATPPDSDETTSKPRSDSVKSDQQQQKLQKDTVVVKPSTHQELLKEQTNMKSEFAEVKQMYEEERERRQQLQNEINDLMEDLQNKKPRNGPSLELDLAVGHLAKELKSAKSARRATIGPCEVKLLETPPSCTAKQKNPKRKNPRSNLESSFLESVSEDCPKESGTRETLSLGDSKVKVTCQVNGKEGYTSYLIELWTGERSNGRIIETRYSKFKGIYEWVKQHSRGGLLSLPTKVPRTSMIDSSSTSKKNIRRRRRWLESTLRNVHYEQYHLLEPLLDHIARLNSTM